jgi:hypothetical protein
MARGSPGFQAVRSVKERQQPLRRRQVVGNPAAVPTLALETGRLSFGVDVPPEHVDATVPLVWDLLEGLVGLFGEYFEPGAGDGVGHAAPVARRQDGVELTGHHKGGHRDLRQAVDGVVLAAGIDLRLEILDGLLVWKGQRLLDDLLHCPIRVCGWRIDPCEEGLDEGAVAGGDRREPAPEVELAHATERPRERTC